MPAIQTPREPSQKTELPRDYPHKGISEDQKAKYKDLLEHLEAFDFQPPLSDNERFYLSEECLLRFLRATKWHVDSALIRIKNMLAWRRSWKVEEWTPDYISPEQETGKQLIYGWDFSGRPLWIMRPKNQNTDISPRQLHHMFYFMSLCEYLMPRGVEQLCLCVNFAERSSNSSIKQGREALSILQNHYPERLGQANFINMPWVIVTFLKMMLPLVDPVTRQKVFFDKSIATRAPADQLEDAYGGNVSFAEYDHQSYWFDDRTSLTYLALDKRQKYFAKWQSLGGTIGIKEWDYKEGGGSADAHAPDSVSPSKPNAETAV